MPRSKRRATKSQEYEFSFPSWFSPWGAAASCSIAIALALGSLFEERWPTIAFSVLGGIITVLGIRWTKANRQPRDKLWFAASGSLSVLILILIAFAPGILNGRWGIDRDVPKADPNLFTVVPRNKAMEKGRPLAQDEVVDSTTDWIRQDDAVILIDSVKLGQVAGKGETAYLLVQFRVVNSGQGESISLAGFAEHQPVLKDGAGRTFSFLEQRLKRIKNKSVVFEEWSGRQSVEIQPRNAQDVLLIFESPRTGESLQLEVSSAAWGRQGVCRFQIAGVNPPK
jgi:hypothetical protein